MVRTFAAAVVTVAALAAPAAAAGHGGGHGGGHGAGHGATTTGRGGHAVTVHDARDDVRAYAPRTKAPRRSVDILEAQVRPLRADGKRGYRYSTEVSHLRVPKGWPESQRRPRFVQVFALGLDLRDASGAYVTFSLYDHVRATPVIGGSGSHACPRAVLDFDTTTDTVNAFIPNACLGHRPSTVVAQTLLETRSGRDLASDHTRYFDL